MLVLHPQSSTEMIRVLLAEDQAMVRGALSALLKLESDLDVIGSAADGEEAWQFVQRDVPDVVVTDIEMPRLTGLELARRIRERGLECKVVIVTTFARPGFLRRALDAGVSGYLLKDAPADQLADALRRVHRGGRAIDPQLALEAWSEADPLNDRERQVLRLAGEGASAGDIAEQLHLSQGTVRNYLSEAIGKLGVGNRIEAYRLARQKGWLQPTHARSRLADACRSCHCSVGVRAAAGASTRSSGLHLATAMDAGDRRVVGCDARRFQRLARACRGIDHARRPDRCLASPRPACAQRQAGGRGAAPQRQPAATVG